MKKIYLALLIFGSLNAMAGIQTKDGDKKVSTCGLSYDVLTKTMSLSLDQSFGVCRETKQVNLDGISLADYMTMSDLARSMKDNLVFELNPQRDRIVNIKIESK